MSLLTLTSPNLPARDVEGDRRSIMSFLRSPIVAGPVWPSVLTGIFSYQSITLFCVFAFIFIFYFYH